MEFILNFLRTDIFLVILLVAMLLLVFLYIMNVVKLSKLRNSYKIFMKKLGNGNNIDEMLKSYIKEVEDVKENQKDIKLHFDKIEENLNICVQKIGLVRYSAFKDTGSDLSFTLALLNQYNDGIVLNGIYSREMSNIYAKPISKGTSTYTLSEEEKEAINRATLIEK